MTVSVRNTGVVWATSIGKGDLEIVGGKGANLGEMMSIGLPVPPAFVVTAGAFRDFLAATGLKDRIYPLLEKVDVDDNKALHAASDQVRQMILETPMPAELEKQIVEAYRSLAKAEKEDNPLVAVRSSATAEDLPEASFAGQQDTYLNVRGDGSVTEHVRRCWASLYTPRAIFYRSKQRFEHAKVNIAVVVQRMVDAEKAGVMFTKHPTTGEDVTIIEGAWGLGEGVVSGSVSPDHYVLAADGKVLTAHVASKETMHVRGKNDRTVVEAVPKEKREARVVGEGELKQLQGLGRVIEKHYHSPQDIEWAFDRKGTLYVLQTRPITTIQKTLAAPKTAKGEAEAKLILQGLGASPGAAAGKVARVDAVEELDKCLQGDILVTTMTTPDMVPAMRRAAAIVTDEGGMTCHAAIVSRELGVPCVVGTKQGTKLLQDGAQVSVDGDKGHIYEGEIARAKKMAKETDMPVQPGPQAVQQVSAKPLTATQVKVNISMPEAIDRALRTDPDGVGLLRVEHIILGLGKHPHAYLRGGKEQEYVNHLATEIRKIVEPLFPRMVWVRTLDAPTDEFRAMEGGDKEPHEHNPMLGWRGIRRSLDEPDLVKAEFKAIKKLVQEGYTNIGVMLPLVNRPEEIREAKRLMREVGLEPHKDVEFGIMVEIPAAALIIDQLLDEGLDFVSFGTNDLTQYTLAVDRNNENVAKLYSEFHPAIAKLIEMTIKACRPRGVQTSICGQAGSNPKFVEKLIQWGITSVSANIDALPRVREAVARAEQRILLEDVRKAKGV
ncbi:MAG TPA: phosphoenolpyruvate synthase [Candidatus Thermoplasmatota archaeon]|nr:phosphoenolpyruvate synthase [Candidatus Thermoplasmatota archaeon]